MFNRPEKPQRYKPQTIPVTPGEGGQEYRPLHLIWIVDCSESMHDAKIESVNHTIKNLIPELQRMANNHLNAKLLVRVIAFSSGAQWHVADPTPIADFTWTDLSAQGATDMGHAMQLTAEGLKSSLSTVERTFPPVLILLSDGYPTDNFQRGLEVLLEEEWGMVAIRIAIGIGKDANEAILQKFISVPDFPNLTPLHANNEIDLGKYIWWATITGIRVASLMRSTGSNVFDPNAITEPNPQDNKPSNNKQRW